MTKSAVWSHLLKKSLMKNLLHFCAVLGNFWEILRKMSIAYSSSVLSARLQANRKTGYGLKSFLRNS